MRHKLAHHRRRARTRAATLETLIEIQERTAEQVAKAAPLSPMEASDREDALADWLDDHGIAGGWQLAPIFVQAGSRRRTGWTRSRRPWTSAILEGAIRWLNYTVETELLMNEIEDSTTRISDLVDAAKQYSQLDRAPYQVVDVHELLDSTLMMLAGEDRPRDHGGQGLRPHRCRRSPPTRASSTRCGRT